MTFEENLRSVLTRIATEFKTLNLKVIGNAQGDLSGLTTEAKGSLVGAINELKGLVSGIGDGLTMAQVNARIEEVIGVAPEALDTLAELALALNNNPDFGSSVLEALSHRLRIDAAQTFTEAQKTQGLANLGAAAEDHNHSNLVSREELGDLNTNFIEHFESGLS